MPACSIERGMVLERYRPQLSMGRLCYWCQEHGAGEQDAGVLPVDDNRLTLTRL